MKDRIGDDFHPCDSLLEHEVAFEYRPGDAVGGYVIEECIGRGGMSVVYAAHQTDMDRRVAIKILNRKSFDRGLERLRREALTTGSLKDAGIAQVYGIGITDDGYPYLCMEFVEGRSLDAVLKDGALSGKQKAQIILSLCAALEHAHEAGIVHRDIKPQNVFVSEVQSESTGIVRTKLLDFGIASYATDGGAATVSMTGAALGSPLYMSPEQCAGQKVDNRSDIYSLGCIIYEMICGAPPFVRESAGELLVAHLKEEPPIPASMPESFRGILTRTLAKNPEERFSGVGDLRQAIESAGEILPVLIERSSKVSGFPGRNLSGVSMVIFAVVLSGIAGFYIFSRIDSNSSSDWCDACESALKAKKKPPNILSLADRAVAKDSANWRGYYLRGEVNILQGNLDNARADLLKAIELNPSHARSHLAMAHACEKDNKEAIKYATAALEKGLDQGDKTEAREMLACLYYKSGLYSDAVHQVDLMGESETNWDGHVPSGARIFRARAFRELGQLKRALDDYSTCIEYKRRYYSNRQRRDLDQSNKERAQWHKERGQIYSKLGMQKEAEEDLKQYDRFIRGKAAP